MEITDIKVQKIDNSKGSMVGRGSFKHGVLNINFTVMNSSKGLFVSLPRREYKDKQGNRKWATDVFVEGADNYKSLQTQILEAFNNDSTEPPAKPATSKGDGVPF